MHNQRQVTEILDEIRDSVQEGYLSEKQVQMFESKLNQKLKYDDLMSQYQISGRTALTHELMRTSLEYWTRGMKSDGNPSLASSPATYSRVNAFLLLPNSGLYFLYSLIIKNLTSLYFSAFFSCVSL